MKRVLTLSLALMSMPILAIEQNGWHMSSTNIWYMQNNPYYDTTKESSSKLLTPQESIAFRQAVIKIQPNIVNSFTFKLTCSFNASNPSIEFRLSPLDISMLDMQKGYVFARFCVDSIEEFSLRGEIVSANRILFAPFTKNQSNSLNKLISQMNTGTELKIALLEGKTMRPREFSIPLSGVSAFVNEIKSDCSKLSKAMGVKDNFLPDYLTIEPKDAAIKDFSLIKKDEPIMPPMMPEPVQNTQKATEQKPPVYEFTGDGGMTSIGPDGKPLMPDNQNTDNNTNTVIDEKLKDNEPMSIGSDGKPIIKN